MELRKKKKKKRRRRRWRRDKKRRLTGRRHLWQRRSLLSIQRRPGSTMKSLTLPDSLSSFSITRAERKQSATLKDGLVFHMEFAASPQAAVGSSIDPLIWYRPLRCCLTRPLCLSKFMPTALVYETSMVQHGLVLCRFSSLITPTEALCCVR